MSETDLPVAYLAGPTASGKSGLALELAGRIPVEIVNVDSAQVYRGMDIGSAKPPPETRARVAHHLIDVADPSEAYSAARFRTDATAAIADIRARGRIPLLVGGTMLYFSALDAGLSDLPPADPAVRARISADAARIGWPGLHARLAGIDPDSAARLHPNDAQRIQRALEIAELAGVPASRLRGRRTGPGVSGRVVRIALVPGDRKALHERIRARFMEMMEQGFLREVRALRGRGDLSPGLPSMRSVGYRQLWAHLDGQWDLPTAVERGVAATRQLAKRQLTWLRSMPDYARLDPQAGGAAEPALRLILERPEGPA